MKSHNLSHLSNPFGAMHPLDNGLTGMVCDATFDDGSTDRIACEVNDELAIVAIDLNGERIEI